MTSATAKYRSVIIEGIRHEANGVKTFYLAATDGEPIAYTAGQFITFVFSHHGKEERRSFSIASGGDTGAPLAITVKRVDNGVYSRFLHDKANVGDVLQTTGAAGLFTFPQQLAPYRQVFFFAAGIGITPILALIRHLLATENSAAATLIYSNPHAAAVVYKEALDSLQHQHPDRFKVEYLYSSSFDLSRARLNKQLLPLLVQEYAIAPLPELLFYTCGPYAYMRMVTYGLEEMGAAPEQIRKENFNTEIKPNIVAQPPDKDAHKVTVLHNGERHELLCQYPDTILKAAKKAGLNLPYSCETGRCGSCAARCISGKVWLAYNEVLPDLDLRHGSILTCTGYPVGGDVVIEA